MKKQFFTFLMMIALVIVAGKAMAQKNTSPYANGSTIYRYQWSDVLPVASTHNFYVLDNAPTTAPPTSSTASISGDYSIATSLGNEASTAGGTATVNITWNAGSKDNTYYVVFVAKNPTCTNFRYVTVTPKAPVDFVIFALGVSGYPNGIDGAEGLDIINAIAADGGNDCPPFPRVGAVYNSIGGLTNDGDLYVFFKVERLDGTTTNSWTATLITTGTTAAVGETQYSSDGTTWGASTTVSGSEFLYVRYKIDLPTNATNAVVSAAIDPDNTYETTGSGLQAKDFLATNNGAKDFTVNPAPAIGGFTEE